MIKKNWLSRNAGPIYIAIGGSGAEGLADIEHLLHALPASLPAVVMVVLHRPADKISHLRDVLSRRSALPVIIARQSEVLKVATCYIGEPDNHLTLVSHNMADLLPEKRHPLRNRTIDALFKSLAAVAGPRTIGIVLSGLLDDGSRGLEAIHHAGGLTMVLQPARQARGMQQNAIDFDGPISLIGNNLQLAEGIKSLMPIS